MSSTARRRKVVAYDIDGHPDELMDKHWVAARCSVSQTSINRLLADPSANFPQGLRMGTKRLWKRSAIEQYLQANEYF